MIRATPKLSERCSSPALGLKSPISAAHCTDSCWPTIEPRSLRFRQFLLQSPFRDGAEGQRQRPSLLSCAVVFALFVAGFRFGDIQEDAHCLALARAPINAPDGRRVGIVAADREPQMMISNT